MRGRQGLGLMRSRDGLAALEFALVLPVMVTALLATADMALASITSRRLVSSAQTTAEIASALAVQQNNHNTLSTAQTVLATDSVFGVFPGWKNNTDNLGFAMTLTGVTFTATPYGCQTGCSYTAQVAWSISNGHGMSEMRPCGALPSAANTAPYSQATLPAGTFSATSLLVADVDYTYKPVFFGFITGNIRMQRSAYVPPRLGNGITYVAQAGSTAVVCAANATQ